MSEDQEEGPLGPCELIFRVMQVLRTCLILHLSHQFITKHSGLSMQNLPSFFLSASPFLALFNFFLKEELASEMLICLSFSVQEVCQNISLDLLLKPPLLPFFFIICKFIFLKKSMKNLLRTKQHN